MWHKPPTRRSIHPSLHLRQPHTDAGWKVAWQIPCCENRGLSLPPWPISASIDPVSRAALADRRLGGGLALHDAVQLLPLPPRWPRHVGTLACSSRPSSTISQPHPSFLSSPHDLPARPPSAGAHATRLSRLFTRVPPSASPLKIGRSSFLARSAYLGASLPVADSLEIILGIRTVRIFAATRVSVRNSHASFLPVERRNRSFHRRSIYLPARTVVIDCIGGLKTL